MRGITRGFLVSFAIVNGYIKLEIDDSSDRQEAEVSPLRTCTGPVQQH